MANELTLRYIYLEFDVQGNLSIFHNGETACLSSREVIPFLRWLISSRSTRTATLQLSHVLFNFENRTLTVNKSFRISIVEVREIYTWARNWCRDHKDLFKEPESQPLRNRPERVHFYKYYVYTLAYPDGRVFYVGKGQGDRIDQHEKEAAQYHYYPEATKYLPKESPKVSVIREIWDSGGKVVKAKVFETDDEQEANEYEKRFIAQYDEQFLTNRTKGGGPQFSKRDPYARLKQHRQYYYSPKEACEKLGVPPKVWNRLALAGVVNFYTVEGCRAPVLTRKAIDELAEKIQNGIYPIDAWM